MWPMKSKILNCSTRKGFVVVVVVTGFSFSALSSTWPPVQAVTSWLLMRCSLGSVKASELPRALCSGIQEIVQGFLHLPCTGIVICSSHEISLGPEES